MRRSNSIGSIDESINRNITSDKYNDIIVVAQYVNEIAALSPSVVAIDALYSIKHELDSLFADKATLDSLFADKLTLDSLYADKATLDSLFADKVTLDSLYADKGTLDSLFNDKLTLDRLFASISNIDRVFTSILNVDTVAGHIGNVDLVGAAIASVDTVATNIGDVVAVSGDIANVATVAGSIGNVNLVATDIVPNLAEILLADDHALEAAHWANYGENLVVPEGTGEYSSKHYSIKSAASALAASQSEGNAASSASSAAGSASSASQSATDAQIAQVAAETALHAFTDQYLGSFTADPTLDNSGNPLTDGDLYFNTSANLMKVYDVGTTTWLDIPNMHLANLGDVTLTSVTTGDILKWNGTQWVNTTLASELDGRYVNVTGDTMTGNLTVPNLITGGLVDGRDVSVDGTKLDTIETNAKDDQLASEVPVTPVGNLTSTNVQAGLGELQSDIDSINSGSLDTRYYTETELLGSVGRISSPLLDLPLKNSLAMKAGVGSVTYTRASTATYIDRYGVLKSASVDEPRFEKDGLLIEGASTNLNIYSEDLTQASWTKNGITSIAATSFNTESGVQVIIAGQIASVASASEVTAFWVFDLTNTLGDSLSLTIDDGTTANRGRVIFDFSDKSFSAYNDGLFTNTKFNYKLIGTTIQLEVTTTTNGTNARQRMFSNSGQTTTGACNLYRQQLEALPFATSYIPTTTAQVTRSADVCSVTYINNDVYYLDDSSIFMEAKTLGVTANYTALAGSNDWWISVNTNDGLEKLYGYKNSTYTNTNILAPFNNMHGVMMVYSNSNVFFYVDGILKSTVASLDISPALGKTIFIGSKIGSKTWCGHIRNFKIYDNALTATEVALLGGN